MPANDYPALAQALTELLGLSSPPLAVSFAEAAPGGVPPFDAPVPPRTDDGRTGRVSAGCVFWMKAAERTFATAPEDHDNCSVGSVTHGLKTLDQVAHHRDVSVLLESGWVSQEAVPHIPAVRRRPGAIVYGPLAETPADPDVVLLRVNAKQVMLLADGLPELRIEGKPQCHILALAKEEQTPAASVGCMLSRVRTGMPATEMTCALPGARLDEMVERLQAACGVDRAVAEHASRDADRFRS
ncbi:MAG: DUF169 domain-containing protein [Gammaproteobacteria bacterium]|nr:DUF169 domain-containing protein [Gammaproteobacteria bacterium]